jgi:hypothetical protein
MISRKAVGRKIEYSIADKGLLVLKELEAGREDIFNRVRKNMNVMSRFLDENIEFGVFHTKKKECPQIMIPALRIGKKMMMCLDDEKKIDKLRKILLKTEKDIDNLLRKRYYDK